MSTLGQGMSSNKIEQIIAQRVTNAIEANAIYETKTHEARDSIDQVACQGARVVNNVNNKMKWESGHDRKTSQQQSKQQKVTKACVAGPNNKRGYARKLSSCHKCKLHHIGPCHVKCKRCKKVGHQSKDCWSKTPVIDSKSKHVVTCFRYDEQGHYKNRCPRLKNQNHCNQKGKKGKKGKA
ncbi:reverse transcriptase domain-containing protein [Tanacetum coccineum]